MLPYTRYRVKQSNLAHILIILVRIKLEKDDDYIYLERIQNYEPLLSIKT